MLQRNEFLTTWIVQIKHHVFELLVNGFHGTIDVLFISKTAVESRLKIRKVDCTLWMENFAISFSIGRIIENATTAQHAVHLIARFT